MPPAQQRMIVATPFSMTAAVILLTGVIVGFFYCLDALHGERRDRSILFWKSMPVSDTTTVLSKAMIPFAVIPAVAFVVALATQLIVLVLTAVALSIKGVDTSLMFDRLPLMMPVTMLYGVVVHAFWYLPLYALFLMVSATTRRPFLWIMVPPIVIQILEKIAFNTSYSGDFIKYRLMGAMAEAFKPKALDRPVTDLSQLDPTRFLSSPGLWLGLIAAAAFLYAAIRLRRSREPL
jgi:ABC-2 type transport system permease protein